MTLGIVIVSHNPRRHSWWPEAYWSAKDSADQLVIVDHGSTEEFPEATERLEKHGDLAAAYNFGVSRLKTEWVMMFGDDDVCIPVAIERLKVLVQGMRTDTGGLYTGPVISIPVALIGEGSGHFGSPLEISQIAHANHIAGNSWFKYSLWEELQGFEEVPLFDWRFWVKAAVEGYHFDWHPEPVVRYRLHADQYHKKVQEVKKP